MNGKKNTFLLLLFIVVTGSLTAQKKETNRYTKVDNLVAQISSDQGESVKSLSDFIKSTFDNEEDRIRAIFSWIAFNIAYDTDNMFNVDINETDQDKIFKALKNKRGICENYSLLFDTLCCNVGIQAEIIQGYTKQNDIVDNLPHSWNAANINNKWYLFDPTWGAGGVKDGKFTKQLNDRYYKVESSEMIKTHMPFDYLWQFLEYPVNTAEFYAGVTKGDKKRGMFTFTDSIAVYNSQTKNDQLKSVVYRVEKNGIKNMMTIEFLKRIKTEIENNRINMVSDQYNAAIDNYNGGIKLFNEFINYRNNKFSPQKEDSEIQRMLDSAMEKLNMSKKQLLEVKIMGNRAGVSVDDVINSNEQALTALMEQQEWLKSYFKKNKLARKLMFQKVSWFGIPLN